MDRLAAESEEDRDLIVAVKIEGSTYAEIAEDRGLPAADAVRMRVKRAMRGPHEDLQTSCHGRPRLMSSPQERDELLWQAIESGQLDDSLAIDAELTSDFAAYRRLESLFAGLRAPAAPCRHRLLPSRIGRYELHEAIGRGAFGTVYLATDPQLDRPVAIKVPHAQSFRLRPRRPAIPGRSQACRSPETPWHRDDSRRRPRSGLLLHRHGVREGRHAAGSELAENSNRSTGSSSCWPRSQTR